MAEITGIALALIAVFAFFALLTSLGFVGVAIWFGCLCLALVLYRVIQHRTDPGAAYDAEHRGRHSSLP